MTNVGYWTPMKGEKGADHTLVYLIAHKDMDAAKKSWAALPDRSGLAGGQEGFGGKSRRVVDGAGRREVGVSQADGLFGDEVKKQCNPRPLSRHGKRRTS